MSNGLSVVVPSKNIENLLHCIAGIRKNEPDLRIIVVDDGLAWNSFECRGLISKSLKDMNVEAWEGLQPFIFARNMNIGIRAAGADDVCLCNDDAILESPNGFSIMQQAAEDDERIGLISATTNVAGNPEQFRHKGVSGLRYLTGRTPGNSFPTVAFVCVFIPRRTIDTVGLLDERFTGYGSEDNDYCRRCFNLGLKIAVYDGCYVDHGKLKSSFRGAPNAPGKTDEGRRIYMEKWKTI